MGETFFWGTLDTENIYEMILKIEHIKRIFSTISINYFSFKFPKIELFTLFIYKI